MTRDPQFRFDHREWLLIGRVLNEVTHGFKVNDFELTIGATKAELVALLDHLQTLSEKDEVSLDRYQTQAVKGALQETIRELGMWEFHTRTGYGLEEGKVFLAKLESLLAGGTLNRSE